MIRQIRQLIALTLALMLYVGVASLSAVAKPLGAGSQSGAVEPDPDRKWEVGFQAGGAFIEVPTGGRPNLLPPGVPFTTLGGQPSRYVSSLLVGDGALLFNQVLHEVFLSEQVVPLDLVAYGPSVERKNGASFGFRLGRRITSRFSAELVVDYSRAHLAISPAALAIMDITRTSLVNAISAAIAHPEYSNVSVTSSLEVNDPGVRILTTGVVSFALKRTGRFIPYVSGGAGVLNQSGGTASARLQTRYAFTVLGFPIDESDTVVFDAVVPKLVGVVGGGARYFVSSRWGFRGDVLVYLGGTQDNALSLSPNVVTIGMSGLVLVTQTTPSIQYSNLTPNTPSTPRSSLTGPNVSDFRTFDRGGTDAQLNVSLGLFWRF